MHRFFHVAKDGTLEPKTGLEDCLKGRGSASYIWLDYVDPVREDLSPLVQALSIHPLSIEDCLDTDQVPKVENFDGNAFILINAYAYEEGRLVLDECDFVIGRDFLITVRSGKRGTRWSEDEIEAGIKREAADIRRGPDFLLHLLIDHVLDGKYEPVQALEAEIEAVEDAIIREAAGFDLRRLSHLRGALLAMRKELFHEREALVKICRRDFPFFSEKSIYHYRDIYDHLTKLFEEIEIYREILISLAEMHLSLANNRMSRLANKTNMTVRRLTLITTIFMPLTLLASVGGMSEFTMMTGQASWRTAYPLFMVGMAVVGAASYLVLRLMESRAHDATD